MCYDVASGTKAALKYAKHRADDPELVKKLEAELELWIKTSDSYFYVSGFSHPNLLVFTQDEPMKPQYFVWGLIPHWIKDSESAKSIMRQTLNARSESMFEKPSFRESSKSKRCLIFIDAFYEYHHHKGKTYPFHIHSDDDMPLCLAGIWDSWVEPETGELIQSVAIVTKKGNALMANIHNNPKLAEARMPVILERDVQENWLHEFDSLHDKNYFLELIDSQQATHITAYTVGKLKGKNAIGNIAEVEKELKYPELMER